MLNTCSAEALLQKTFYLIQFNLCHIMQKYLKNKYITLFEEDIQTNIEYNLGIKQAFMMYFVKIFYNITHFQNTYESDKNLIVL